VKVVQENWTIQKLIEHRAKINLNPAWQRGPAWKTQRQVLLIDSILRGMDIPKIYLRRITAGGFPFEAVDGQQRLRAIWAFQGNELALTYTEALPPIDGKRIDGKLFRELPRPLRDRFNAFVVSVARIVSAETDEITTLFARLQMGVSLNPAELRNAMLGPVRHVVDTLAVTHPFFINGRISEARYKRQDFVTHIMALAAYQGKSDIKAPDLKRLVREYGPDDTDAILTMAAQIGDALNVLDEANSVLKYPVVHKWLFVDLCWFIMQREANGGVVDPTLLAQRFAAFDALRRKFTRAPEEALDSSEVSKTLGKHLYAYLVAFKTQGGTKEHLAVRSKALGVFLADV